MSSGLFGTTPRPSLFCFHCGCARRFNESGSAKTTPAKESIMQLNPYLNFNGQCEEAFKFYERCLGGKIVFTMTYGESPMADKVPADWRKKILHVRLMVGDEVLMGADAPPEHYEQPKGFSVTLSIDDPADAERIFH